MKNVIISLLIQVISLFITAFCTSAELYFIFNGPTEDLNSEPIGWETRVYEFDANTQTLSHIWSLGKYETAWKTSINYTEKIAAFLNYDYDKIGIFQFRDFKSLNTIYADSGQRLSPQFTQYRDTLENKNYILAGISESPKYKNSLGIIIFDISEGKTVGKSNLSNGEFRVWGSLPRGLDGTDMIPVSVEDDTIYSYQLSVYKYYTSPIDPKIVRTKPRRGGNIIANEPGFLVIQLFPNLNDLSHREFLIYNRILKFWKSYYLEGGSTSLHLANANGWLVGEVKTVNDNSDYAKGFGESPIPRGDFAFLNPLSGSLFYHDLGRGEQVLFVEDSTVYYKLFDELYKAKITDDGITDAEFILRDEMVRFFRAGFSGE